jgi:hypothetical protein
MSCKECKAKLYPSDPTVSPGRVNKLDGRRLPPLCYTCSYYETAEYYIEQLQDEKIQPKTICTVQGCPIWRTVAQFKQEIAALKAEVAHVHKQSAKKKTESKEGYW